MTKRWFGPKTIGYGIGPKGAGGWAVMALHLAVTIACIRWGAPWLSDRIGVAPPVLSGLILLISLVILITVMIRTYRADPK